MSVKAFRQEAHTAPIAVQAWHASRVLEAPVVTEHKRPFFQAAVKRFADIVCGMLLVALLAVPMLLLWAAVRALSGSAVMSRQERLGKDGKPFIAYGFCLEDMEGRDDGNKARQRRPASRNISTFLRATRLDTLPQLFNVLRGDMSFVGPQAAHPGYYAEFEQVIHGFSQRLTVKPGLTGWAQIHGGYELSPVKRLVYDIEYIQHRSLGLDVRCIFRTLPRLLKRSDARG